MSNKYYNIQISWDEKLLKNRAVPQSVKITSKEFDIYMRANEFQGDWNAYSKRQTWLFDNIPEPIYGKLDYKGPIDYMWPYYVRNSMIACVSEKVKTIFERLNVSKEEYILKRVFIKGYEDTPFYLLFVPLRPANDIIFPACTIVERGVAGTFDVRPVSVQINNYDDLCKARDREMIETSVRELVVKKDYYGMDVFQFQGQMAVFCLERLANAFREENVVGAEISEGDWFHSALAFQ